MKKSKRLENALLIGGAAGKGMAHSKTGIKKAPKGEYYYDFGGHPEDFNLLSLSSCDDTERLAHTFERDDLLLARHLAASPNGIKKHWSQGPVQGVFKFIFR